MTANMTQISDCIRTRITKISVALTDERKSIWSQYYQPMHIHVYSDFETYTARIEICMSHHWLHVAGWWSDFSSVI